MWVSEIFCSVQGEGTHVGVPSAFLRTSGCNLRCTFCDTPYTSWQPAGVELTFEAVLKQLTDYGVEHVVITGGEPVLIPEIVPLTKALTERGHYITIETAGTVFREVSAQLISLSPKLSNSVPVGTAWELRHAARRHRPQVIERWLQEYACQFKFVIDQPEDIQEVESYLREFAAVHAEHVFLMPQGTNVILLREKLEWLSPMAAQAGWKVSPRLHIELFGNTRGT